MHLRIESTKSKDVDPLAEFVAERPQARHAPAGPAAAAPASAAVPLPRQAVSAAAVSLPAAGDHAWRQWVPLAAAVVQAPLVALWLMGVPSPLESLWPRAEALAATPSPASPVASRPEADAVAFVTAPHVTGGVMVTTQPGGSPITIDGVYRGRAPITISDLAAGTHTVSTQFAGRAVERAVTIEAGTTVPILLVPAKEASTSGRLLVDASVPLQVYENGTAIGSTRGKGLTLPAGEHLLEIGDDRLGFRVQRQIRVEPAGLTSISIDVPFAPLAIDAQPWAAAWVDGTPVGTTPLRELTWPIGLHEVRLRHPELGERTATVLVTLDGGASVSIDLRNP